MCLHARWALKAQEQLGLPSYGGRTSQHKAQYGNVLVAHVGRSAGGDEPPAQFGWAKSRSFSTLSALVVELWLGYA